MYKITIEKFHPEEEKNYDKWEELYKQNIENLCVENLVVYINNQNTGAIKAKQPGF